MKNKRVGKIKWIGMAAVIIVMAAVILVLFLEYEVEKNGHYRPSYKLQELETMVADGISEEEYKKLFFQTGLGKEAVDRIKETSRNPIQELEMHQENFFAANNYSCERITPITGEEQSIDEEGNATSKFTIQGLEDGDILISLSTHSLGWRHGHAAIVVDADQGTTLESLVLGKDSEYQYYKKWERYPTFIQLRMKKGALEKLGVVRETGQDQLTETAREKLNGIPYGLFAGIPVKYIEDVEETHCAHLVWYAYAEAGLDIDSDKGIFVTPYDMAHSDLLEVVQIYGVNPEEYVRDLD